MQALFYIYFSSQIKSVMRSLDSKELTKEWVRDHIVNVIESCPFDNIHLTRMTYDYRIKHDVLTLHIAALAPDPSHDSVNPFKVRAIEEGTCV